LSAITPTTTLARTRSPIGLAVLTITPMPLPLVLSRIGATTRAAPSAATARAPVIPSSQMLVGIPRIVERRCRPMQT
jgi:hypothetical protein